MLIWASLRTRNTTELDRQRSRGGLERTQIIISASRRRVRVEHDRRTRDVRRNLLEQIEPFTGDGSSSGIGESRHVAAGVRKTGDKAGINRVGNDREHDRDRMGFPLQRGCDRRRAGQDYIGLKADKLFCESASKVDVSDGPALLDASIAAVRPAEAPQFLHENGEGGSKYQIGLGQSHQHPDPTHAVASLRSDRKRPNCRAADCCDKATPPHLSNPPRINE